MELNQIAERRTKEGLVYNKNKGNIINMKLAALPPKTETLTHLNEPISNLNCGGLPTYSNQNLKSHNPRRLWIHNQKRRHAKGKKLSGINRKLWDKEEDEAIVQLVGKYGFKKWMMISTKLKEEFHIFGRSSKQCRERWYNHLNPMVKKEPISKKEEKTIFKQQRKIGNKWAEIAKFLPGRTDNTVKNHFYSALRREIRGLLRTVNGKLLKEPKEVSISILEKLAEQYNFPVEAFKNENIRNIIKLNANGPESKRKNCNKVKLNFKPEYSYTKFENSFSDTDSLYYYYYYKQHYLIDNTFGNRFVTKKSLDAADLFVSVITSLNPTVVVDKNVQKIGLEQKNLTQQITTNTANSHIFEEFSADEITRKLITLDYSEENENCDSAPNPESPVSKTATLIQELLS